MLAFKQKTVGGISYMRHLLCAVALALSTPVIAQAQSADADDPYLWLAEV